MTVGFIGTLSAYIIIAVLLLSFNIAPRWSWWVKATGIVVTSVFFVVSYYSIIDMMGWPVEARLPERFQLHWARVSEPDRLLNTPGAIYVWVEELDEQNIPLGMPRAYKLPYSAPLDNGVNDAMDMISMGQEVGGTSQIYDQDEDSGADEEGMDPELEARLEAAGAEGAPASAGMQVNDTVVTLQELQAVRLPGKDATSAN